MTHRIRRRHRWVWLSVSLLASACGRPAEPLEVGVREVRNDIVLGAQGEASPAASTPLIPPTSVVLNVPTQLPPAPPRFAPTPAPPPTTATSAPTRAPAPSPDPTPVDTCPAADPLEAPRLEASRTTAVPPVEQTLTFRNQGSFTVSGENANEGTFSGDSTRTVSNVRTSEDGTFTYDVVAELSGTTTTTTYRAVTRPPDDTVGPVLDQNGVRDTRGLYLVRIGNEGPDGSTSTFAPATPLLLLPLPASNGATFSAQGLDPVTQTTMSYDGVVGESVRVNACGEPVHGITVELSNGRIVGPSIDVTFEARYVFATQFGGLIIEDEVTTAGTEAGETSTRTNLARINQVPLARDNGT